MALLRLSFHGISNQNFAGVVGLDLCGIGFFRTVVIDVLIKEHYIVKLLTKSIMVRIMVTVPHAGMNG